MRKKKCCYTLSIIREFETYSVFILLVSFSDHHHVNIILKIEIGYHLYFNISVWSLNIPNRENIHHFFSGNFPSLSLCHYFQSLSITARENLLNIFSLDFVLDLSDYRDIFDNTRWEVVLRFTPLKTMENLHYLEHYYNSDMHRIFLCMLKICK